MDSTNTTETKVAPKDLSDRTKFFIAVGGQFAIGLLGIAATVALGVWVANQDTVVVVPE